MNINLPRLKRLDAFWLLKLVAIASSTVLFLFQSINSFNIYLNRKKLLTSSLQNTEEFTYPSVTVCANVPFDWRQLKKIGLKEPNYDGSDLSLNVFGLEGIDRNLTTKQLQHIAGWPLGSLLEETRIGDFREAYDISTSSSDLWLPSFRFMEPCFTLKSATVKGETPTIQIKPRKQFGIESCTWYENENLTRHFNTLLDCPYINEYCNTSCPEEDMIAQFVLHVYLESVFKHEYSSHMVPLDYAVLSPSKTIMELQHYKVSLILDQDPSYEVKKCFKSCLEEFVMRPAFCKPFDFINHDYSLDMLCFQYTNIGENYFLTIHECPKNCPPKAVNDYWKIMRTISTDVEGLIISAGVQQVKHINEYETYPEEKLLSDIGGNLGLLLGISIFSLTTDLTTLFFNMWRHPVVLERIFKLNIPIVKKVITRISHFLSGSTIFIFLMLNLTSLIHTYINQGKYLTSSVTSIRYRSATSDKPGSVTLQDWVYGYLASHSLGCRVIPPDQLTLCLQTCILKQFIGRHSNLLPYMLVENLLPCSEYQTPFSNVKYTIPDIPLLISLEDEQTCSSQCEHLATKSSLYFMDYPTPNIAYIYPISTVQLICNIGGVIGLYFGYCLLDIHELAISPVLRKIKTGKSLSIYFSLFFLCTAGILGASICLQQVYIFLFMKPVLTSSSISSLSVSMLPAISLCPWPPVLNLSIEFQKEINGVDSPDILQQYLQMQTSDISDMSEVWDKLWTISEDIYCSDYGDMENKGNDNVLRKDFASFFGKCFTCIPKPNIGGFQSQTKDYCINIKGSGSKSFLFQIHDQNVIPFWNGIQFNERIWFYDVVDIDVRSLDYFIPTTGKDVDYGDCMTQCFLEKMSEDCNCKLTGYEDDGTPYYQSKSFSELATNLTMNMQISKNLENILNSLQISECDRRCKNSKFRSLNILGQFSPFTAKEFWSKSVLQGIIKWGSINGVGVCAHVKTDVTEEREESFSYSSTQLLSDIGGIASFTTGISLLTLLLKILKNLDQHFTKN